jgi:hypothetical protein
MGKDRTLLIKKNGSKKFLNLKKTKIIGGF